MDSMKSSDFWGLFASLNLNLASVLVTIREANYFNLGIAFNFVSNLSITRCLGVQLRPLKALSIKPMFWFLPNPQWIKFNSNGVIQGSPGNTGCGRIFRNIVLICERLFFQAFASLFCFWNWITCNHDRSRFCLGKRLVWYIWIVFFIVGIVLRNRGNSVEFLLKI